MSLALPGTTLSLLRRVAMRQPGGASAAFEAPKVLVVAPRSSSSALARPADRQDAVASAQRHLLVGDNLLSPSLWPHASSQPILSTRTVGSGLGLLGEAIADVGLWLSSTLKKRRTKMNKHKLRKRKKKERLKSK